MPPKKASSSGCSVSVHPWPRSGNVRSYSRTTFCTSADACSSEIPSLSRPTPRSQRWLPCAAAGAKPNGIQASDDAIEQLERRGHDADDGGALAVDERGLANDVGTASEPALPQRVAQHDRALGAAQIFSGAWNRPSSGVTPSA